MKKSPTVFQEIENKLVKDDYASKLPVYHPAKGRRKRGAKAEQLTGTTGSGFNNLSVESRDIPGSAAFKADPDGSIPDVPPEIEKPDEEEIFPPTPGEREIDPQRDLPQRELPHPDEEELPAREPGPEIEQPGKNNTIF